MKIDRWRAFYATSERRAEIAAAKRRLDELHDIRVVGTHINPPDEGVDSWRKDGSTD